MPCWGPSVTVAQLQKTPDHDNLSELGHRLNHYTPKACRSYLIKIAETMNGQRWCNAYGLRRYKAEGLNDLISALKAADSQTNSEFTTQNAIDRYLAHIKQRLPEIDKRGNTYAFYETLNNYKTLALNKLHQDMPNAATELFQREPSNLFGLHQCYVNLMCEPLGASRYFEQVKKYFVKEATVLSQRLTEAMTACDTSRTTTFLSPNEFESHQFIKWQPRTTADREYRQGKPVYTHTELREARNKCQRFQRDMFNAKRWEEFYQPPVPAPERQNDEPESPTSYRQGRRGHSVDSTDSESYVEIPQEPLSSDQKKILDDFREQLTLMEKKYDRGDDVPADERAKDYQWINERITQQEIVDIYTHPDFKPVKAQMRKLNDLVILNILPNVFPNVGKDSLSLHMIDVQGLTKVIAVSLAPSQTDQSNGLSEKNVKKFEELKPQLSTQLAEIQQQLSKTLREAQGTTEFFKLEKRKAGTAAAEVLVAFPRRSVQFTRPQLEESARHFATLASHVDKATSWDDLFNREAPATGLATA